MHANNQAPAILDLLKVMSRLRAPDGCPWDRQQTPASLAPYILEEAAEVVDAIEAGDEQAIREEAGDLLLQVVFIAQIFQERGSFDFSDVARSISEKLRRRHPHVFADSDRRLSQSELDRQWEAIKNQEKIRSDEKSTPLGHIPVHLPALQRAQKVLDRVHKNGLPEIPLSGSEPLQPDQLSESALGESLFNLAIQAQNAGVDAEQALRLHVRKVIARLNKTSATCPPETSSGKAGSKCLSQQDE